MRKYFLGFLGIALIIPKISSAHSFGTIYSLPVPFWIYLYGGMAAMFVSFLFIGYFFNKKSENISYSKKHIFTPETNGWFFQTIKILSVLLLLFTILTGALGQNNSYANFNMNFFWIIFVLGLTYLSAIAGDVYSFINPWKILTQWLVGNKNEKDVPLRKYPEWLSYYPALIFYFIFIWIELVGHATPFKLSIILLAYTILNDLGVIVWGREAWFKYCEFFSVFFRLIGKIAPVEYESGKIYLRKPFVGLLKEKAEHFSLLLFTLFMLSSTAFDGFKETITYSVFYWGHIDDTFRPIFDTSSFSIFATIALFLSPLFFLLIYLILIYLAKKIARSGLSLRDLALRFAFSLIPIALVYNLAHYYTLIFTEGPNIIRLISDPFGFGWNIFHTSDFSHSIILQAGFVWHSQVFFILAGHIVSVYLTHVVALNTFPSNKRAFWSQFPMLLLMIAYTMIGLWILSQPLTGGTL